MAREKCMRESYTGIKSQKRAHIHSNKSVLIILRFENQFYTTIKIIIDQGKSLLKKSKARNKLPVAFSPSTEMEKTGGNITQQRKLQNKFSHQKMQFRKKVTS